MTAKEKTIKVVVLRDYWDAEGIRHGKGSIHDVAVDVAMDGVEAGQLMRYKG